ncbi:MAG: entericidin A/B family lipoprotein [Tepidisphaeraceae bacterium]
MKSRFITRALSVLVLMSIGLGAIGCNTTEGVGKDMKDAGEGIRDAARDAK